MNLTPTLRRRICSAPWLSHGALSKKSVNPDASGPTTLFRMAVQTLGQVQLWLCMNKYLGNIHNIESTKNPGRHLREIALNSAWYCGFAPWRKRIQPHSNVEQSVRHYKGMSFVLENVLSYYVSKRVSVLPDL